MRFIIRSVLAVAFLAFAALAIWLLFAPRYDYDVVMELPTNLSGARGAAFVGVGSPGEEVGIECPLGIVALEGSQLALIDTSTRRILTLDTAQRSIKGAATIELDPALTPTSAIYEDGTLLLWISDSTAEVQLPVALVQANGAWLSRGTRILRSDERAYKIFRDRGLSQRVLGESPWLGKQRIRADDLPATEPMARYVREPSYTWTEAIPGAANQADRLNFQLTGRWLTVDSVAPDGSPRVQSITAPREILTATALGAGPTGEAYVTIQNWNPESLNPVVRAEVYRTDQPDVVYDIPLSEGDCIPTLQSAVTKFGGIYVLRVREKAVSVLQLRQRSLANQVRALLSVEGIDLPHLDWNAMMGVSTASAQELQADGKIDRETVINNACAYLKEKWTWTPANATMPSTGRFCRCEDTTCDRYKKVGFEPAKPALNSQGTSIVRVYGRIETGLPYLWGGGDSIAQFKDKIAQGKPAGNICTSRDYRKVNGKKVYTLTDAVGVAGVDCSGFVTRALGYPARVKHVTSDFGPQLSVQITVNEIKPGDIANKAGSHVMMILAVRKPANGSPPSQLEVIEAVKNPGGVRRFTHALSQLLATTRNGEQVKPYEIRRPVVIKAGTTASPQAMTCSSIP